MIDENGNEIIPAYSVADIARWRRKLREALSAYVGQPVQGASLYNITKALVGLLIKKPHKNDRVAALHTLAADNHVYTAVYNTLLAHAGGALLDPPLIARVANILAGNVPTVLAGSDVPVWRYQTEEEWVLAKIVDTYGTVTPRQQIHGHTLVMELLTGGAASHTIHQFATDKMLSAMARKLGIRSMKNRRPVHARELTMLYLMVKLKKGEKLESSEYRERSGLNTRNRQRGLQRSQYKELCPIQSKWPCTFCRMGYGECQLGTHPHTYVRGTCREGHSGWVPEEGREPQCMACQQRRWAYKHGGTYVRDDQDSSSSGRPATTG